MERVKKKAPKSSSRGAEPADIITADLSRRVAQSLKELRKARGLSMEELSERSQVSKGTLSQIETAKTNPTIGILWKVSTALGVPFSALLGEAGTGRLQVLRRESQQVLRSADGRLESRPLSIAGMLPGVEVYELRIPPRATSVSEPHAKGTMESVVVLVGTIRLSVADETCDLAAGDAVCFQADLPHRYENPDRAEARCLDVIVYSR